MDNIEVVGIVGGRFILSHLCSFVVSVRVVGQRVIFFHLVASRVFLPLVFCVCVCVCVFLIGVCDGRE
jgi:hypothetical protein